MVVSHATRLACLMSFPAGWAQVRDIGNIEVRVTTNAGLVLLHSPQWPRAHSLSSAKAVLDPAFDATRE